MRRVARASPAARRRHCVRPRRRRRQARYATASDAVTGDIAAFAFVPHDIERGERLVRLPPTVGDHRHRGVELHDFVDAFAAPSFDPSIDFSLPLNTGACITAACSMPGRCTSIP